MSDILSTLDAEEKAALISFKSLQEQLFPDGNIPDYKEVRERLTNGTATVRDGLIAKMYDYGVPENKLFNQLDETKEFAAKFHKAFSKKVSSKAAGVLSYTTQSKTLQNNFGLNNTLSDLEDLSKTAESPFSANFVKKIMDPMLASATNVIRNKLSNTSSSIGTGKLARGVIPPEILPIILEQISVIRKAEGEVAADAVLGAMMGMRGSDLTGTRQTAEFATRVTPQRPYYDVNTGTVVNPVEPGEAGKGLKKIGDDRVLGPVLRQIFNKRFNEAGPTQELFPDMDTTKVTSLINKYIVPKIPKDVKANALLRTKFKYSDLRRITASAIANGMGEVDAARKIISHTGSDDELDNKVMEAFYIDVDDAKKRVKSGQYFTAFEKYMAQSLGLSTASSFAARMGYDFGDFEADYSELDLKGSDSVDSKITETTVDPVAKETNKQILAATDKQAVVDIETQTLQKEEKNLLQKIKLKKLEEEAGVSSSKNPDVAAKEVKKAATSLADLTPEAQQKMLDLGMITKEELDKDIAAKGTGSGKGTAAALVGLTAAGVVTAEDAGAATAELGRDIAFDTAGELGLKKVVGKVAAGRVPFADLVIPSANMADQELELDDEGRPIGNGIKSQQEMEALAAANKLRVQKADATRMERVRQQQLMSRPIPGKSFLDTKQQP